MRNKSFFIIIFFNFCIIMMAEGQSFEWAKRAGWYSFDIGYGVAADDAGNVYISGKYEKDASFGDTRVTCAGNHDIYIAKYGPDGSFKWVRTAGGISGDYAHAIASDGAGNVYITGEIEKTVNFGSVTFKSNGSNDLFIAKYNTNGDLIFAKKIGGSERSDRGIGIALSGGSVYITGTFQSKANFSGTYLSSSGELDIVIVKYSTSGEFQWAKKAGGPGTDEGEAITADQDGNIYVTGSFKKTAKFGSISLTSNGSSDIFIAKYNSSGSCLWAKSAGAGSADYGYGIKADNFGRVFVTGGFRYYTSFGGIFLKAIDKNADVFIACYNSSGNIVWAKRAGGSLSDAGRALAIDGSSNVYITGNYGGSATFGSTTIYGADSTEIYFASYDVAGNFRWVLNASGEIDEFDYDRFNEMGLSICVDPSRNVIASGSYRSASTFGGTTLKGWDHTDVFITKINQSSGGSITAKSATVEPSGNVSFCTGGNVLLTAIEDPSYQYYFWKKDDKLIEGAEGASYIANSPGSYAVMIVSGTDTITSASTKITESRNITATITPEGPFECKDSITVLKANEGYGYTYQWKRDGVAIPGATSHFYKPNKTGEYQVKIIQGSCFDWSGNTKVTIECIKPESITSDAVTANTIAGSKDDSLFVKIFPNPNNGLFSLEINMSNTKETEPIKIELINSMGQIVYQKIILTNNGYINEHMELAKTVPLGIYFLQVTIGNKLETTRMMLSK